MRIEFNEEILEYCYKENIDAKGFLTSCREILIPYMLKKHKRSLKEYIKIADIELINELRTVEIKVFNIDKPIKINKVTFKSIEEELIKPLYNSLKNLNLKYTLRINCYLYIEVEGKSIFSCCWKELRISKYGCQVRFVCPSLDTY